MESGIYSNDFSEAFSDLLEETGISCYQISQYANLDQAYLSRLKKGQKDNPSPETLVKISLAFSHLSTNVKLHNIERLFNSVGRSLHLR